MIYTVGKSHSTSTGTVSPFSQVLSICQSFNALKYFCLNATAGVQISSLTKRSKFHNRKEKSGLRKTRFEIKKTLWEIPAYTTFSKLIRKFPSTANDWSHGVATDKLQGNGFRSQDDAFSSSWHFSDAIDYAEQGRAGLVLLQTAALRVGSTVQ